ncbi:MAG TPA: thermopsin family protease [Thermoplasmata archaeon]
MSDRKLLLWAASIVVVSLLWIPTASATAPGHTTPVGVSTAHPGSLHSVGAVAPTTPASRLATEHRILSDIQAAHVPAKDVYLPNFHAETTKTGGVISPTYSHAPAPIGIAAMGVSNTTGVAQGYVLNSPSFEGAITFNDLNAFYLDDDSADYIGAQLNTVVSNITLLGNSNNSFWNQNVITYSARSNLLQFIDNIWNFSDPNFYMSPDVFNQTSPNGTLVAPAFYYGLGPVVNITMPFTVNLYINASLTNVNGLPYDIVWYNYTVIKANAWVAGGSYDWAIFNSQDLANPRASIPQPEYQVNGVDLTPTGYLPYDSELVFCGPGGGSTTNIYDLNATMNLWFLNETSGLYENVPSAFAYGTNTGETIDGIATWYDATDTVHAGPGPTLPYALWNASPTSQPGYATFSGTVAPSNAFLFFNQSTSYNDSFATWAPVATSGTVSYQLPLADYSGWIALSNYDPVSFTVLAANVSTWTLTVGSLTPDASMGIYTPLYAWDNSQLATISTSGSGAPGDPYLLMNNAMPSLDPIFGRMNDFTFPVFAGLQIVHTTAYATLTNASSFNVDFTGRTLHQAIALGLPTSNSLQLELYGVSHVTIWGAPSITGWFSGADLTGFPIASVMVWNSSHVLLGGNYFWSQGTTVLMYGGSGNTVWGNWFLNSPTLLDPAVADSVMFGTFPFGPQVYESGDTIYNNDFANLIPAYSPLSTIYYETFYDTWNSSWVNAWNVSYQPATDVNVVNGVNLTGSITGSANQGGNLWWNWGQWGYPLPFDGGFLIAVGGDWFPLGGDSLTLGESGLPDGTFWSATVDGIAVSSTTSSTVLQLSDGTYDYTIDPVAGYTVAPSSGSVTLLQGPGSVVVAFSLIPSVYNLQLNETGLPGGTVWSGSLNGVAQSSNTTEIDFAVGNGSYTWGVDPVAGRILSPTTGTVTIDGGNVTVDVTFSAPAAHSYTVTFVALGLPSGTGWVVTFGGTLVSSALDEIMFPATNGTYPYTIGKLPGYTSTLTAGNVTVSGAPAPVDVAFAAVAVTLSGTVHPAAASLWVDGHTVAVGADGTYSVSVTPGVHSVEATAEGYIAFFNNVTVAPGTDANLAITMNSQSSGASSSSLSGTNLAVVAGLALLALIFLIGMIYFWSRARRPPMVMRPESTTTTTSSPTTSETGTGGRP